MDLDLAVEITQDLVRLDTTTGGGSEAAGLRRLSEYFAASRDYRLVISDQALVVVPRHPAQAQLLLFSGHIDTVSARPEEWHHQPWSGDISDGKLWGRGSSDMKSGLGAQVAAMLTAGPTAPVALAVSTREEWCCAGSPDVLAALSEAGVGHKFPVSGMIVAEPTDSRVVLGHKGPLWLDVVVRGTAAHGSMPELGDSAITKAASLILRAEREMPRRSHPRLGRETLNVGRIEGGSMRNVVADECVISLDIRTVTEPETLILWWQGQPEVAEVRTIGSFPPVWSDDPWTRTLAQAPELEPVPYGTEAAPLGAGLGWPPLVIWGPGNTAVMHKVDEYVEIDAITRVSRGYLQAIPGAASLTYRPK